MKEPSLIVVFITTSSAGEAEGIARALLRERLAACVNIIPGVHSLFWWQGKIDSQDEFLLVVKTEERCLEGLIKLVRGLHSYSLPEIIALPIIGGDQEYLKWVKESCAKREEEGRDGG